MVRILGIEHYETLDGKCPFEEWMSRIRDIKTRKIILNRLDRLQRESWGSYNFIGDGIWELKIPYGSGYRIYYSFSRGSIIILLCGGDKSTQQRDIRKAKLYWNEFKYRNS